MSRALIVVEGYLATAADDTNLREELWSLALDQRAFGPRRLLVAVADRSGRLWGLAYTDRTEPPEAALGPCLDFLGGGAAAVAYSDEPVVPGSPPPDTAARFQLARTIAASFGVRLVDWIACDDTMFRSFRLAVDPEGDGWDVP